MGDRDTLKNLYMQENIRNGNIKYMDEDVFSPFTSLLLKKEVEPYRKWADAMSATYGLNREDFDSQTSDYDYKGFFIENKHQPGKLNPYDGKMHFTDKYKTPYHETFSNESMYAIPDAPHWEGNRYLKDKKGNLIFDEKTKIRKKPY